MMHPMHNWRLNEEVPVADVGSALNYRLCGGGPQHSAIAVNRQWCASCPHRPQ